jgi:hypothetical protein
MRAWYLHRTVAGVKYAFNGRSPQAVENLFFHCLGYRKSYCQHTSTDFDQAYNLGRYLQEISPESSALQYFDGVKTLLTAYRGIDWIPKLSRFSPLSRMIETRKLIQQIQQHHQNLGSSDRHPSLRYEIFNDNRHEQHAFLWLTDISGDRE